jgi:subfamily B ATP-binding cassette protein MsbA
MSRKEIVLDAMGTPINEFLSFIAAFIIVGTGLIMIHGGSMQPNELVSFILYLAILSQPLNAVTNLVLQYKKATASAERIFEVLDEANEDTQSQFPDLPKSSGKIQFRNVSFSYDGKRPVLRNFNLTIKSGETIALVGPSGGGKTTFVNLLSRLFIPLSGKIFVDDIDTSQVSLVSLRKQIGYVTQESILFPGTVRENILYGNLQATDEQIRKAAKNAHADGFIQKLPKGYNSRIGERGSKLSGGQRQRIALARVMLRQPAILVLDEATSSLDAVSERHVQKALEKILHKQTTIIIAHRLSTVQLADRILVLDKGRISESGTHASLLKNKNSLYSQLWKNQNSNSGDSL